MAAVDFGMVREASEEILESKYEVDAALAVVAVFVEFEVAVELELVIAFVLVLVTDGSLKR